MQQLSTPNVSPLLLNMLTTSLHFLVDEREMNAAVESHLEEIKRLTAKSDQQLTAMGISRDQITAYVLHEAA